MFQVVNGAIVGMLMFGALGGLIAFNVSGGASDATGNAIVEILRWVCTFLAAGSGGIMGAVVGATAANAQTKPMSGSEKVLAGVEVGLLVVGLLFAMVRLVF